uniref:Uncharacterized protein n=1 Tax=Anguilla anguilla TaxID=7936 RepID=A0A0E9VR41_ANGAN
MVITCKYGEYMGTYFYGSLRTSGVKHRGRTCTSCINVKKPKMYIVNICVLQCCSLKC